MTVRFTFSISQARFPSSTTAKLSSPAAIFPFLPPSPPPPPVCRFSNLSKDRIARSPFSLTVRALQQVQKRMTEGSMDEPSSHATSSSSSFITHYLCLFHPSVIVYSFIHLSLFIVYCPAADRVFILASFKRFATTAEQWSNVYLCIRASVRPSVCVCVCVCVCVYVYALRLRKCAKRENDH